MRALIFHFLILVILSRYSLCYTSFQNTYLLQDKLNSAPCAILNSSPPVLSGATIFSELGVSSTNSFPSLMITGWYILRGFSTQIYTLFSVHDNGIIAALSYSSDSKNYVIQLKSSTNLKPDSAMNFNEWIFLKFQVILSPSFPQMDQINFYVEKFDGTFLSYSSPPYPNSMGDVMSFSSSMNINIGFSDSTLGLFPSCSLFKYVTLYLDYQQFDDSSISKVHSKKAFGTYLLWYYDFTYSVLNKKKLLSSGKDQDILNVPKLSSNNPKQIPPYTRFLAKSINSLENNGFIIYLEMKFQSNTSGTVVVIMEDNNIAFGVFFYMAGQIMIYVPNGPEYYFGLNYNQWYQIVLVVERIKSTIVRTMIKDVTSWVISYPYHQIYHSIIYFGDTGCPDAFFIDNIRVYSGTFISEDDSCFYTGRKERNCLFCKLGYDLSYQNGMTCIAQNTPPTPTTKKNIQDWIHSCPLEQTYKGSSLLCSCRFGTYLSSSGCLLCPTFCKGCTGPSNCLEKDLQRDSLTGECDSRTFDDGYYCITRFFSIPFRQNIVRSIPQPSFSLCQSCIIFLNDLQQNSIDSFFLSFFIQNTDITNANSEQILAYIKDEQEYIFTISIKKVMNSENYICFYNLLVELKCFINSGKYLWIGLWTYQKQALLTVGNRGIFFYETYIVFDRVYIHPSFCVGFCLQTTGLMLPSVSGGFSNSFPFTFVLGMKNPSDAMNDFFDLQQITTELILSFNSMDKVKLSNKYRCTNQSTSILYQGTTLDVLPLTVSQNLMGFLFKDGISAQINQPIPGQLTNSIAMNIFINQMIEDFIIFELKFGTVTFQVSAISADSYDQVFIRICESQIYKRCQQTQYASLTQKQPNFLAMIMRDLNPESDEFYFYEFEFVCNFKRERLKFTEIQISLALNQGIAIPSQTSRDIYVNNLKVFQGSDFYFEYSLDDPCFLYYDLSDMKCIKAKQGYAVFNGLSIPIQDCFKQTSKTGTMLVYNKYTNECMKTTYVNPLCKEINEDMESCKECIDPNANLENQCKCNDGYYSPSGTIVCLACHIKCSTCSTYDICTTCKYSGTFIPYCYCISEDQYLDSKTYECKNCSNQCATCQGNPDDCTLCSENRIDPPTCGCNPRYFNTTLSNTQVCTLYDCSKRCDTCEYSMSTCITCAPGRVDPPYCNCDTGYYESGILCLSCPSHQFYDSTKNMCLECDAHCKECLGASTTCTNCDSDFFLINSSCLCSDFRNFTISSTNKGTCSSGMNASLSVEMRNSMYSLVFTFEEEITLINFDNNPIDTILFLYIQKIPSENYFIKEAFIEGKKLIAQLSFKQSFSASSGGAIFIQNSQIISISTQKILDQKYLTTPLTFKIGPLLIADDEWQPNPSLQQASDFLKTADSSLLTLIRQFSIIFYILNTLQPCVALFMTKMVIPPNLYQSFQIIALMVFPNVQDYSIVETSYEASLLGFQLNKDGDLSENETISFRIFGLSNSMLVNIPIALLQFLIWPIVLCIVKVSLSLSLRSNNIPTLALGIMFILRQINSNNEMALLLISTACLNQFFNFDTSQYFNRISCYLALVCIMVIMWIHFHNYQHLKRSILFNLNANNSQALKENKELERHFPLDLLDNLDFKNRPKLITYFFFSQIIKKYLLSIFLICFQNQLIISFSGCLFIFLASALLTAVIRPYKTHLDNLIKLIGEICLFSTWMIYLIKFAPFLKQLNEPKLISSTDIREFLAYGNAVIYILIAYNSIYLVGFVWGKVILKIVGYLFQTKNKNDDNDQTQGESQQTQFLQYNQSYLNSMTFQEKMKKQELISQNNNFVSSPSITQKESNEMIQWNKEKTEVNN